MLHADDGLWHIYQNIKHTGDVGVVFPVNLTHDVSNLIMHQIEIYLTPLRPLIGKTIPTNINI